MEGKGKKDQGVVGSAELLDTEETRERLRELEAWGVDLTLVRASLNRTPTERIERMLGLLELADELRQGYASRSVQSNFDNGLEHLKRFAVVTGN